MKVKMLLITKLKIHCRLWMMVGVFLLSFAAYSKIFHLSCPENITTNEKLEKTPSGFTSRITEARHYWETITFYSGNPQDNASLAPEQTTTGMSWQFSKNDKVYMGCAYHQSKIELFQMLPKNTSSCTVLLDNKVQGCFGSLPKKVRCQTE